MSYLLKWTHWFSAYMNRSYGIYLPVETVWVHHIGGQCHWIRHRNPQPKLFRARPARAVCAGCCRLGGFDVRPSQEMITSARFESSLLSLVCACPFLFKETFEISTIFTQKILAIVQPCKPHKGAFLERVLRTLALNCLLLMHVRTAATCIPMEQGPGRIAFDQAQCTYFCRILWTSIFAPSCFLRYVRMDITSPWCLSTQFPATCFAQFCWDHCLTQTMLKVFTMSRTDPTYFTL